MIHRQSLLALCLEEQALRPSSLNCTYCDYVSESQVVREIIQQSIVMNTIVMNLIAAIQLVKGT